MKRLTPAVVGSLAVLLAVSGCATTSQSEEERSQHFAEALQAKTEKYAECYGYELDEAALKRTAGKSLLAEVIVEPSGEVRKLRFLESGPSAKVEKCLEYWVKKVKFPEGKNPVKFQVQMGLGAEVR